MGKNIKQNRGYTNERNIQILISLLKVNGIRRVIVSPGATNVTFVGSLQNDDFFELYSCMDERSAAYMALGMSEESGEPVVLSCTGATSSREYMPALTAAYYHKLPILAVTSSQVSSRIGQLIAQVTDRTTPPLDVVKTSFQMNPVLSDDDEWDRTVKANEAISALTKDGGGPVHINMVTTYSPDFSISKLPATKQIKRVDSNMEFPDLPKGKIGIFVGSHATFSKELTLAIDNFCLCNNAVVFCDHSSGYYGKYRVQGALPLSQRYWDSCAVHLDLLIHIGNVSGDYSSMRLMPKQVWRVSEDGLIKDLFHAITYIFNLPEVYFFKHYSDKASTFNEFLLLMRGEYADVHKKIPELPFGNIWLAQQTAHRFPTGSVVHFGILNTLRSWDMFSLPKGVESQINVGGFGIDGTLSSLVGASLANKTRIHFGIFGDLSFFYDMNVMASGLVGNNVRLLIINNGIGAEFRLYSHPANRFGDEANQYMAASGHNGNKSGVLIKDYATDLGFEYLKATSKQEYLSQLEYYLFPETHDKPIIFEVFTSYDDESESLRIMEHLMKDPKKILKHRIKSTLMSIVGESCVGAIKKVVTK